MRIPVLAVALAVAGTTLPVNAFSPDAPATNTTAGVPSYSTEQWTNFFAYTARARTVSQKLAKEYFFIASGVDVQANRKNLSESIALFEATMNALSSGDNNAGLPKFNNSEIQGQFDKVTSLFNQVKPFYTSVASGGTPSRENFPAIDTTSTQLLETINKINTYFTTTAEQQLGNTGFTKSINAIATNRTLSQQLAKEFTLVYLGVFPADSQSSLRTGAQQFESNLTSLQTWTSGNNTLLTQLTNIKNAWSNFQPAIAKGFNATPTQNDVATVYQAGTNLTETISVAFQTFASWNNNSQITNVPTESSSGQ